MKRILTLALFTLILSLGSCSKVEDINDPVLGFWDDRDMPETAISAKKAVSENADMNHEWIFNDAYMGRYQTYKNNKIDLKTDFRWSEADGTYTISYPGTDLPDDIVTLKGSAEGDVLEFPNGTVLALRN